MFFLPLSKTENGEKLFASRGWTLGRPTTWALLLRTWKSCTCRVHLPWRRCWLSVQCSLSVKSLPENFDPVFSGLLVNIYPKPKQIWLPFLLKTEVPVDLVQLWQNVEGIQILIVDKFTMLQMEYCLVNPLEAKLSNFIGQNKKYVSTYVGIGNFHKDFCFKHSLPRNVFASCYCHLLVFCNIQK